MVDPGLPPPEADPDVFCCALSRELKEPLLGTAVDNRVWFLLEYDRPWRAKATEDNELPREVQSWLDAQVALTKGRLQFIKQERRETGQPLAFYVVQAGERQPRMFRFQLEAYADLLQVDVTRLLASDGEYKGLQQVEPLYLVCTNGRRDRCCALYGLEVYYRLRKIAADQVWQTTHVGGHRFAANVLTFPDATYYGRMQTNDLESFYQARERGEMVLEHLRGRSCYREVAQAADYYLRRETEQRALDAFHLVDLSSPQPEHFRASFELTGDDARYDVYLVQEVLDLALYGSCGEPRTKPTAIYRLKAIEEM
jgi:hypothetical protein